MKQTKGIHFFSNLYLYSLMRGVIAVFAFAFGFGVAHADYPDHAIKMVVPYPAGGATDVVARAVAQKLGDRLKQAVVIENRGGASGQIGADYVGKATPEATPYSSRQRTPTPLTPLSTPRLITMLREISHPSPRSEYCK